jgi:hypothetical protein
MDKDNDIWPIIIFQKQITTFAYNINGSVVQGTSPISCQFELLFIPCSAANKAWPEEEEEEDKDNNDDNKEALVDKDNVAWYCGVLDTNRKENLFKLSSIVRVPKYNSGKYWIVSRLDFCP